MMMFGLYATGEVPFRIVALHGMVRDAAGRPMSKSRGNVVDPLDWIDRYGADALRFTLGRGANPGSDPSVSEEWMEGSRNFVNKIWNAVRLATLRQAAFGAALPDQLSVADRWILSRLGAVTADVTAALDRYEFGRAGDLLFHFAWDEVCDWYLELAKVTIDRGGEPAAAARAVLGRVFDVLLRLLHPLVPFVTEALWTTATGDESLVVADWPVADPGWHDADAERDIARLRELVTEVRRFRAEQGLRSAQRVPAVLVLPADAPAVLGEHAEHLGRLAALDPLRVEAAAAGARVALDLSGAIDVAAERARLGKNLAGARRELEQVRAKLGNAQFLDRAPAEVVDRARARETEAAAAVQRLSAQLAALPAE
jgi:valyl-tRNA synthetase